ncbi:hypothetical protein evm_007049 [Chilo suppressalis]|nr:hypothetical protein evm_007049 [Chilo suppressalis]
MNLQLPDNVKQEFVKSVPASTLDAITCFVFYDNHPRDEKNIDVTVCNYGGEIIEYYKRELVCSLKLSSSKAPSEIKILRNGNCELFYLVVIGDEVLIISRKHELCLHRRVVNVDRYTIEDISCRGQACLKIIRKDDAVPMVFDDNFDHLGDRAMVLSGIHADDSLPILTELMRKLTETKYSVKCNEKTLNELLSLRQMSALSFYQQVCPNTDDSVFQANSKEVIKNIPLDIRTQTPWVKFCNKRIIIVLTLSYTSDEPLEDIQILLHGTDKLSIIYTTKLFEKIKAPPFWKERNTRIIKNDSEIAVTAVINTEELKHVLSNKIEFNGALFYNKNGKEYLIPFDHVFITCEEISEKQYDVLTNSELDEMSCLAILASTSRTDMVFRHIRKDDDPMMDIAELFCMHLHMEFVQSTNNIIVQRNSPYHVLNGVMLVFQKDDANGNIYNVSVYTRSPSQVTTLMYYVHNILPHQIVMTAKHQRITAKKNDLLQYNEPLEMEPSKLNYEVYGSAIVNQSNILLEYLDTCMMKMSSSKDAETNDKIGTNEDKKSSLFVKSGWNVQHTSALLHAYKKQKCNYDTNT